MDDGTNFFPTGVEGRENVRGTLDEFINISCQLNLLRDIFEEIYEFLGPRKEEINGLVVEWDNLRVDVFLEHLSARKAHELCLLPFGLDNGTNLLAMGKTSQVLLLLVDEVSLH